MLTAPWIHSPFLHSPTSDLKMMQNHLADGFSIPLKVAMVLSLVSWPWVLRICVTSRSRSLEQKWVLFFWCDLKLLSRGQQGQGFKAGGARRWKEPGPLDGITEQSRPLLGPPTYLHIIAWERNKLLCCCVILGLSLAHRIVLDPDE